MVGAASKRALLLASAGALQALAGKQKPNCDAQIKVGGDHGADNLFVIPTGWKNTDGYAEVPVVKDVITPEMGGRAYFADTCTAGKYNNTDYARPNLLGKTMLFSTDLTGAGCGCNAAFYLTSMGHNREVSECFDHYCDANDVCGCSCAEIDIMEANQHAWHSTLHTKTDTDGAASGFGGGGDGWNGPRNWTAQEYGVNGSCIDTAKPFDIAVSFPIDKHGVLVAMQVTLSQKHHSCKLQARVDNYAKGMKELTHALLDGMTPIVSYWADDTMTWMDGLGADGKGPCTVDHADKCADSVKFWGFKIQDLDEKEQTALEKAAKTFDSMMEKRHPHESEGGAGNEWWNNQDSQNNDDGGNEWWHPDSSTTNKWWHPDDGSTSTSDNNNQDGGNQWWHPEQASSGSNEWDSKRVDVKAVAGSDSWDGKASLGSDSWSSQGDWNSQGSWANQGGNQWQKPAWEENESAHHNHTAEHHGNWDTENILMQKSEEASNLRGVSASGIPGVGGLIGASVVGGVILAAATALVLQRSSAQQTSLFAGTASAGVSSMSSTGCGSANGGSTALRRLRNSLSSGDIGSFDGTGSIPMPMLQQPPSSQNLLAMGTLEQAA